MTTYKGTISLSADFLAETLQARKHLNLCPEAERSWSHCILYWLDLPVMPLVLDGIIYKSKQF